MSLPLSAERAAAKGLTCPRGHSEKPYPDCCNDSEQLTGAEMMAIFDYIVEDKPPE